MEWQPIETAPTWRLVLVYQAEASPTLSNDTKVFTAVKVEEGWALSGYQGKTRRVFNNRYLDPEPTHWMPLPDPPESNT